MANYELFYEIIRSICILLHVGHQRVNGEKLYMKIIEGALDTLKFFYFLANDSTNPDVC